ncbi:hypothetical protein [Leptospira adleri]|uniref:AAA family ATPase n=1 Tax=Leptospira adleri TaxID=2023186 RepID=A0ABX4NV98_9LEPT|nr:hypothetical protein [Leptospira adleri]PJZ60796.1 hypothetical protein CH376_16525 [Leptospira adleri]
MKKAYSYLMSSSIPTIDGDPTNTYEFVQKKGTVDELLTDLVSGHSIVPVQFKEGETHRKAENYESANFILLDIDGDLSIENAKEIFKDQAIALLPTRNHQKEKKTSNGRAKPKADRFRILFRLPISVSRSLHRAILSGCSDLYHHDKSCIDAARFFFTVENGESILINKSNTFDLKKFLEVILKNENIVSGLRKSIQEYEDYKSLEDLLTELKVQGFLESSFELENSSLFKRKKITTSIKDNIIESVKNNTYSLDPSSGSNKKSEIQSKVISDESSKRDLIRNYDWKHLEEKCALFRKFEESSHGELIHFITNLHRIQGGRGKLKELLKRRPFDISKRKEDYYSTLQTKLNKYNPINCSTYCSHYATCGNQGNLLTLGIEKAKKIKKIHEEIEVNPLDVVRSKLSHIWNNVQADNSNLVHLIIAPPGAGKTFLLESIRETDGTQLIAGPRIDQINEMQIGEPFPILNTKKYPALVDRLEQGFRLKELAKNSNKTIDSEIENYLSEYFEQLKSMSKFSIVKMTHERLLGSSALEYVSNLECIYIDEDVADSILKSNSVKIEVINELIKYVKSLDTVESKGVEYLLNQFANLGERVTVEIDLPAIDLLKIISQYLIDYNLQVKRANLLKLNKESNRKYINAREVFELCCAEYGIRKGDEIHFNYKRKIPKVKTVILSATPHVETYKRIFDDRLRIYDIGFIEPKGNNIQFPNYSFSKTSIKGNVKRVELLLGLKKVLSKRKFKIISHLSFAELLDLSGHFYATEGQRKLEGKRIAVIGTPYPTETYLKLKASILGFDSNSIRSYSETSYSEVEYSGYRFMYKALSELPELINLQMHYTNRQLVQAVGRARNNIIDQPVLLFSNFPLRFFNLILVPGRPNLIELCEEALDKEGIDSEEDRLSA